MKIYKILTRDQWQTFQREARFGGAPIDLLDGYIHFSTAEQTKETIAKHFGEHNEIVLLRMEADALGNSLKWEPSRGGALFPHVYTSLNIASVEHSWELRRKSDGSFDYPDELN